jgi:outer membrane PBP1 activator LpoA protein
MTTYRFRSLVRVLGLLLPIFALAACATVTRLTPGQPTAADQAEQLYRVGEFEQAANAFLSLAGTRSGASGAHYRLRAAEALRETGDLDRAAQVLDRIKRRHLDTDDQMRLDLLDAEIALSQGDAARARPLLAFPENRLPENLRLRALELRARSDLLAGDRFAAARARAQLDRVLAGPDRAQNRGELLKTLAALEPSVLRARYETLRPDDALIPWIEEALRNRGEVLPRSLVRADRPVGTLLPAEDGALSREGFRPLSRVALLLPFSGNIANVAQPIRDGFLAAYFADRGEQRPDIRLYDSGATPEQAVEAYHRAVEDGADHVVGPLQREAVGLLFHQVLPVTTLALNHPDTGEVPPPGNAEYGLLPDAEGVQAA